MFFQGTLDGFVAYSQIGGIPAAAAPIANGQTPGSYVPAAPVASGTHSTAALDVTPKMTSGHDNSHSLTGVMGKAGTK